MTHQAKARPYPKIILICGSASTPCWAQVSLASGFFRFEVSVRLRSPPLVGEILGCTFHVIQSPHRVELAQVLMAVPTRVILPTSACFPLPGAS
jgi:hypothetical protein